jgi:hypothetical protein
MGLIKQGINKEMSNEDYHGDREYVSSSGLKLMFKNPREFHAQYVLGDFSNSPSGASLDFGSYIHSLILEPHLTDSEFAIYEGNRRQGKVWEEFKVKNMDKTILLRMQANKAANLMEKYNAAKIIIDHPERGTEEVPISSFFVDGAAEETFGAEIDGVKVKVRTDYRKEWENFGSINDVKTTSEDSLSIENIEKICARWSYDISAALYCDVLEIVTGKPHDFYFLFISTNSGKMEIVKASKQMLENGRRKYREAIRRLKIARTTGVYFENKIHEVKCPEWDVYDPENN